MQAKIENNKQLWQLTSFPKYDGGVRAASKKDLQHRIDSRSRTCLQLVPQVWNMLTRLETCSEGLEQVPQVWNIFRRFGTCSAGLEHVPQVTSSCQWSPIL